jgi:hypothetical protein
MGMKIEKSFVVAAARAEVWAFLTDPYQVAASLPGAAVSEKVDDSTYKGTMTVKVGPVQETRGKGAADLRMHSRVVERGPGETEVVVTSDVSVVGVLAQFGRGMIDDVSDQLFGRFAAEMRQRLEGPAEAEAAGDGPGEVVAAASGERAPTVLSAAAPSEAVVAEPEPTGAAAAGEPEPAAPAASRHGGDVLDLGAIGGAAVGRAVLRTLGRPGFWVGVAVVVVILWLVLR